MGKIQEKECCEVVPHLSQQNRYIFNSVLRIRIRFSADPDPDPRSQINADLSRYESRYCLDFAVTKS
jgi:hypothetical protein